MTFQTTTAIAAVVVVVMYFVHIILNKHVSVMFWYFPMVNIKICYNTSEAMKHTDEHAHTLPKQFSNINLTYLGNVSLLPYHPYHL